MKTRTHTWISISGSLAAALLLFPGIGSRAVTAVYTNQASFLSAVGGTPYFLNPFNDLNFFGFAGSSVSYSNSTAQVGYTLTVASGIFATGQGLSDGAASIGSAADVLQINFRSEEHTS